VWADACCVEVDVAEGEGLVVVCEEGEEFGDAFVTELGLVEV